VSSSQPVQPLNPPSASSKITREALAHRWTWVSLQERLIVSILFTSAFVSVLTTVAIVGILVFETIGFFQEVSILEFLTETEWTPQYAEKKFGILPLVTGTFLVATLACLVGTPVGLGAAVYLSEYASERVRSIVKPVMELLAGIPTVVYGFFGLTVVTPYLLNPIFRNLMGLTVETFNAASAGIVVGIMIIPTIASLSEDVLRSVPRGLREAAYGLGSTKYEVCTRVVIPAALSGILAAFLLAVSRAIGETMAVTIAAGLKPQITLNPLKSVETMTAFIVNISKGEAAAGSIELKSLYAVAMTLFCITLVINIVAQFVLGRFREVYN
jgi:phosphate transport system permease protein